MEVIEFFRTKDGCLISHILYHIINDSSVE